MTMANPSPATEARTASRHAMRGSPATSGTSFGVPKTAEEAGKLLSHAERLVRDGRMTPDYVRDLTGFLGANSAAWTPGNRERLHRVLTDLAGGVLEAVVATMARLPRTDILDACELVLRALPAHEMPGLRRLVQRDEQALLAGSVRASLLRAATRADTKGSMPSLHAALKDPDAEVREAAATLVGELGEAASCPALQKQLDREHDEGVRASLREALESLGQ